MISEDHAGAQQRPHPVQLDVEYPERLSRGLIFVKWLLIIPHVIAIYVLFLAVGILTVLAWFAILFTGRYPKAFFTFNSGVLRWASNVFAYGALMRDEYPPFTLEAGAYPLILELPRAERQSRFRLFIRLFAIIPNQIVFFFVQLAMFVTSIIAWFGILFSGRYPRGLFRFNVGVMRWYDRQFSYLYLLRDEYPPYSVNADARPGNEVVSAIVGLPLLFVWIGVQFLPFAGLLGDERESVSVRAEVLDTPSVLLTEHPSGEANNLRVTLLSYDDDASRPRNDRSATRAGYRLVSFRVYAEKDGRLPTVYAPFLFGAEDCFDNWYAIDWESTRRTSPPFEMYWFGGNEDAVVYFEIPRAASICKLTYFSGRGRVEFRFE